MSAKLDAVNRKPKCLLLKNFQIVDDALAVQIDLELQVAFDPVEVDVEGGAGHGVQVSMSRFLMRSGAAAWARFL